MVITFLYSLLEVVMKTLLSLIAAILFCSMSLFAQSPVQDTIPQLKEWWRVDNLQYGKYGMTWLDNFYQGKGALVVWTPQGVKTWLLRFPGDTMNVFSWEKGSSNIKTGDFNGDGITDYIDENSNIYEGVKNGEPPKQATQTPAKGFFPWIVTDINGDGKDDMIKPGLPGSVLFGKSNLSEIINEKMILPGLDSNNEAIVAYMVSPKEMRIVCGHRYWTNSVNYPFRNIYKDGLRLVRAWWDGTGFKSEILDEFTVDTKDGTGLYWQGGLLQQPNQKWYFIHATQIGGSVNNTNVAVYDLSKNKMEKLYSVRMDGISGINSLRYGLDSMNVPSLCIRQYAGNPIMHIYNGNISNSFNEIAKFTTVQVTSLISLPDVSGNGKPDIALSNEYDFTSADIKYRFSILTYKDTANNVIEEQKDMTTLSIEALPPMPVLRSQTIQMKISIPTLGDYNLSLYDSMGKKIISKKLLIQNVGQNYINFDLFQFVIAGGKYTVELEGNGRASHCSIIIQ
jgi:hypothetical protein